MPRPAASASLAVHQGQGQGREIFFIVVWLCCAAKRPELVRQRANCEKGAGDLVDLGQLDNSTTQRASSSSPVVLEDRGRPQSWVCVDFVVESFLLIMPREIITLQVGQCGNQSEYCCCISCLFRAFENQILNCPRLGVDACCSKPRFEAYQHCTRSAFLSTHL